MDIPITPASKIERNHSDVTHTLIDLKMLSGQISAKVIRSIELTPSVLAALMKELPQDTAIYPQLRQLTLNTKKTASDPLQTLAKILIPAIAGASALRTSWILTKEPLTTGSKVLISMENQSYAKQVVGIEPSSRSSNQQQATVGANLGQNSLSQTQKTVLQRALRTYLPASVDSTRFTERLFSHPPLKNAPPNEFRSAQGLNAVVQNNNASTHVNINHFSTQETTNQPLLSMIKVIEKWRASVPNIQTLTSHNVISALKNSGLFLEQTLRQHIERPSSNHAANKQDLPSLLQSDIKAVVLHLLNATRILINQPENAIGTNKLTDGLLQIFVHISGAKRSTPALTREEQRRTLRELERQLNTQLANITTKQVQSIQHPQNDIFSTLLNTDLAFRFFDHLIPVQLKIAYQKRNKKDKTYTKKKREWRFSLDWTFPDCGQFNAEISYIDERLRYRLWVENQDTKTRMRNKIDKLISTLEEKNINVDGCQFVDKPFLKNQNELNMPRTTLIDERT